MKVDFCYLECSFLNAVLHLELAWKKGRNPMPAALWHAEVCATLASWCVLEMSSWFLMRLGELKLHSHVHRPLLQVSVHSHCKEELGFLGDASLGPPSLEFWSET